MPNSHRNRHARRPHPGGLVHRLASGAAVLAAIAMFGFLVACTPATVPATTAVNAPDEDPEVGLVGAWRLVETAVREPGRAWDARPAPHGGLFVFSRRHYSYFYVRGATSRPLFADANRPTEAERAATFDTFIAGAGSYTFDGRAALLRADYRKNPNEMNGAIWRWAAEAAGDTVRLVFADPPFLPGRDWRITLVRAE